MFARMLELTLNPDKKLKLIRKMKNDILPLLNKYHGFVDVLAFDVENEPTKFFAISLWNNRMEMEKYEKELYPKVKTILDPLLATTPMVTFCKLDPTITQKLLTVAA